MIETIVYIGIVGLIVTALASYTISITDSHEKAAVVTEVQQGARGALAIMRRVIRESTSITSPINGTSTPYLLLDMPDMPGSEPDITIGAPDNILSLGEFGVGTTTLLSDTLRATVNFTNTASSTNRDAIRIELTVFYNNDSGDPIYDYSRSYETVVGRRN